MTEARLIRVRGVVQGVGFRPYVYRLARSLSLTGWVMNQQEGVEICLEGSEEAFKTFVHRLESEPPPHASISAIDVRPTGPRGLREFAIRESERCDHPTVRISPDLPVCEACLEELFDPGDQRFEYPYINCTNCGPRYTVILGLPYDRSRTTMKGWSLDEHCSRQYHDPGDRRFHAQPMACPVCGPHYYLRAGEESAPEERGSIESIRKTAALLGEGKVLAIKGLGGYHLACDARNAGAVVALRERKYRKEKPFALMARDLEAARGLVQLSAEAEELLTSLARPIVLAPARAELPGVAPENHELGVMLPYTPLHHLLFSSGAPELLVMTSANRSSEPIAYEDEDALDRLAGIADAFLIGERPIARRVDDSVARAGTFGPMILRRARGYAPGAVAALPATGPVLASGADLKNTITLVVGGQAFMSQHIGDLEDYPSALAFQQTIQDLVSMYEVCWGDLLLAYDAHPQYISTAHSLELPASEKRAVQHHRAHLASVLAERGVWDKQVLGIGLDGTGYGDDGTIWGGEVFVGSVAEGFERVAHLRPAALPGGDAAARFPVQAAAGYLAEVSDSYGLPDLTAPPFGFPERYQRSLELVRKGVRTFATTSMGRLFDAAAALLGFAREVSFEGQAAMWVEHLARSAPQAESYPFPFTADELDFRPLLFAIAADRVRGRDRSETARAFQRGIAQGLCDAVEALGGARGLDTVVLSGGVFQNELLLQDLKSLLEGRPFEVLTNRLVPPNDGGISLGQAALAVFESLRKADLRQTECTTLATESAGGAGSAQSA
jgi:hydrogenase maturation protein HypF